MKRAHEEDASSEDEEPPTKQIKPSDVLLDLEAGLTERDDISQQLMNAQKQYFTTYMEKLMNQLPMGKSVIEAVRKTGSENDFMYMYTAANTIIQSLLSVKQVKATNSMVDMIAGVMCRYIHEKVLTPMLQPVVHDEHLKRAFQAYQASVKQDEDAIELELRCVVHTIKQMLEKEKDTLKINHPIRAQVTQQMKAISDYVVTLLLSISTKPSESKTEVAETELEREEANFEVDILK